MSGQTIEGGGARIWSLEARRSKRLSFTPAGSGELLMVFEQGL